MWTAVAKAGVLNRSTGASPAEAIAPLGPESSHVRWEVVASAYRRSVIACLRVEGFREPPGGEAQGHGPAFGNGRGCHLPQAAAKERPVQWLAAAMGPPGEPCRHWLRAGVQPRAEHGYALRFTEPVNSRVRSCGCGARPVQDACRPSGRRADGGAGASSEVASLRCAGRRGMSGVGSNHHDGREPLMAAHTVSLPIHPPWGLLPKSLTCRRHRLRRML